MPDNEQEKKPLEHKYTFIEDSFSLDELKTRKRIKNMPLISLINIIMLALICYMIYQLVIIGNYYRELYVNDVTTEEFREIFEDFNNARETEIAPPEPMTTALETQAPEITDAPSAQVNSEYKEQIELNAKLINSLREQYQNDEIIGYVYINNTNISYPILQAGDNEYYLTNSIDKKSSSAGAIFLDYECYGFSSRNSILYGHNMGNGSMFHDLRYFQAKDFFDTHDTIVIITESATYEYETFSSYATTTDFNYIQVYFSSDEQFGSFIKKMVDISQFETDVSVGASDRILTLSTCRGAGDDDVRFVLQARLRSIITENGIEYIPQETGSGES